MMFWTRKWKAGKKEYELACMLYDQVKYDEAEPLFRQSIQQREKVLGTEHRDTLDSQYWLAKTLYRQQKYDEVEQLFRQLVQQREKLLGPKHKDTLNSKYWLARTLCQQQGKSDEAEQLLRQLVQQREKVLGIEHKNTLYSKYWLARTLYEQHGKSDETEQLLRQVVQRQEKVLGVEHKDTLYSKNWLARTLYQQRGKSDEAEQLLRQLVHQQEKVLGTEHEATLASNELLQEVILARAPLATSSPLMEAVASRLGDFFVEGTKRQTAYNDSEILQVSRLLRQVHPLWSKVPRTYITLRTIGCLDLLDAFVDLGFSDHWFPLTERGLPPILPPSRRAQFVAAQNLVMTKSLDLEKGDKGEHCRFRHGEALPFEEKGILGTGGFGQVDRVLSLISFREYARKRVPRSTIFGGRSAENVKRFIAEIEILKRLKHLHIAEFVGSYTDPRFMGLIMSPVAEMDMSTYLARATAASHKELRTFFGCLARALEFLHGESIRHKDIKPSNILVHKGNVLFTDFGLASDFTDSEGSTTVSKVNGMTLKYCAPEVANFEPRNTSSDIWSLGLVFLEMTVVLKGRAVESIYEFLSEHGSRQAYVRTNIDGFHKLLADLKKTSYPTDNVVLIWIQDMLMIQSGQISVRHVISKLS
jgi:TolA-binding protein